MARVEADKYTRVAMGLHWAIALLIIGLLAMGWYITGLPKGHGRDALFDLHKSLGLVTLLLVACRIAWRIGHRPPAQAQKMPAWQRVASASAHQLLYLAMAVLPLSGFIGSSFGRVIVFFGIPLPRLVTPSKPLNHLFFDIHAFMAWAIAILVAVHVLAALYHLFILKDGVLPRMLPGRSRV